MPVDDLERRDRRIAWLEQIPPAQRPAGAAAELASLHAARDHHWRRLPAQAQRTRDKLAALERYARRHRIALA